MYNFFSELNRFLLFYFVLFFFSNFSARRNSASLVQGDFTCDVSSTAQRIIKEAVGVWGRLDALINNASQFYATPICSVMEDEWEDLVRANLTSPFFSFHR